MVLLPPILLCVPSVQAHGHKMLLSSSIPEAHLMFMCLSEPLFLQKLSSDIFIFASQSHVNLNKHECGYYNVLDYIYVFQVWGINLLLLCSKGSHTFSPRRKRPPKLKLEWSVDGTVQIGEQKEGT